MKSISASIAWIKQSELTYTTAINNQKNQKKKIKETIIFRNCNSQRRTVVPEKKGRQGDPYDCLSYLPGDTFQTIKQGRGEIKIRNQEYCGVEEKEVRVKEG